MSMSTQIMEISQQRIDDFFVFLEGNIHNEPSGQPRQFDSEPGKMNSDVRNHPMFRTRARISTMSVKAPSSAETEATASCQSVEFSSAVQSALRSVIRLGIPSIDQVVGVNVTNKLDNNCVFPFEVKIRKSVQCSETPCNTTKVGAEAATIIAVQVNETVTTSAADTGPQGLLAKISNEGVNTNGLTAAALVSTEDVTHMTEFGVKIRIDIQTDGHPTEISWTLIDICPDGAVVATGGGYTTPGQTDVRTIYSRNSRYLFNITDTGGDGICCNTGIQGLYKIFVDSSFQAGGAEFGSGDTELFGKEVCDGVTFNPTNVLTASPTNNPTIMPTGQPSVRQLPILN